MVANPLASLSTDLPSRALDVDKVPGGSAVGRFTGRSHIDVGTCLISHGSWLA